MRIGILETGRSADGLVSTFGSYVDFIQTYLSDANQPIDWHAYTVFEGELPESPHACDAYVITGSAHSVYDRLTWIDPLKDFIRTASADYKILGCCFGHQVIAAAFGGQVVKAPQGWGVGYHTYNVHCVEPWMSPQRKSLSLLASHQDQVVVSPAASTILAGSAFCPVGMLAIGDNIMTTQLHPEFPKAFAAKLYHLRRHTISQGLVNEAIESLDQQGDEIIFKSWALNFLCG